MCTIQIDQSHRFAYCCNKLLLSNFHSIWIYMRWFIKINAYVLLEICFNAYYRCVCSCGALKSAVYMLVYNNNNTVCAIRWVSLALFRTKCTFLALVALYLVVRSPAPTSQRFSTQCTHSPSKHKQQLIFFAHTLFIHTQCLTHAYMFDTREQL